MAKTTRTQKLSRMQRAERRQMRRMMLLGGGVFGVAAAAGVGMTLMPPSFPALEGNATIANRLDAEGLSDHVLSLTPSRSTADIVVVGTTDCGACRAFVDDGLENAMATARDLGLGMIYVPIGSSTGSLASTRLTS